MQTAFADAHPSDDDLDLLENFIFSEAVSEDSLDLIGIHGFLCALNISPKDVEEAEWLELIFDGQPNWGSQEEEAQITSILVRWKQSIRSDLYNDRELGMPCELSLKGENGEAPELEIWAQAFMEAVFLNEEAWFLEGTDQEESVAELMLPIMVSSSLFEEEEFREMRRNKKLAEQMANEIPDLLVDLYLLFHAPEK